MTGLAAWTSRENHFYGPYVSSQGQRNCSSSPSPKLFSQLSSALNACFRSSRDSCDSLPQTMHISCELPLARRTTAREVSKSQEELSPVMNNDLERLVTMLEAGDSTNAQHLQNSRYLGDSHQSKYGSIVTGDMQASRACVWITNQKDGKDSRA